MNLAWYELRNADTLDTPAVVVYLDRVKQNIRTLIGSIDDVSRLRPHIKTHKSPEVTQLMLAAGIRKFKCATIAEGEMLALAEAPDVLLAYQPVGPKGKRLIELIEKYSATKFSCLIDNADTAHQLSNQLAAANLSAEVYIDLNVGMNRTGIEPENAFTLYEDCKNLPSIQIVGLHAYDGHIRDVDFSVRKERCDAAFARVTELQEKVFSKENRMLKIVVGGSPTYSVHSKRPDVECSPGTFAYWDRGYEQILKEQHFIPAALVVARVISKPTADTICIDLGHKAVASENVLPDRVSFLNANYLKPIGHSEEHMVLRIEDNKMFNVGDLLYGVPYHVCPTIALHDRSAVAENNMVIKYWETLSRNRRITI